jgi:hypothetical protein
VVVEGGLVGAGRPGGLCGGVPRGRAVALRERSCFERAREQRSLGLNSLVLDRKRQINNTINGSCFQKARELESGGV